MKKKKKCFKQALSLKTIGQGWCCLKEAEHKFQHEYLSEKWLWHRSCCWIKLGTRGWRTRKALSRLAMQNEYGLLKKNNSFHIAEYLRLKMICDWLSRPNTSKTSIWEVLFFHVLLKKAGRIEFILYVNERQHCHQNILGIHVAQNNTPIPFNIFLS